MNQGLIQVDGKFYKKCKVVILPTDKDTSLAIVNEGGFLVTNFSKRRNEVTCQHLYILSDQEIKKGDWYLDTFWKRIHKSKEGFPKAPDTFKKIIATTDQSTKTEYIYTGFKRIERFLPRPSDSFIKKYCELGGIEEILVEYDCTMNEKCKCVYEFAGLCGNQTEDDNDQYCSLCERLKINPDNTITIKPVKQSFSREEVIKLCKLAWNESTQYNHFSSTIEETFIEWTNQNI